MIYENPEADAFIDQGELIMVNCWDSFRPSVTPLHRTFEGRMLMHNSLIALAFVILVSPAISADRAPKDFKGKPPGAVHPNVAANSPKVIAPKAVRTFFVAVHGKDTNLGTLAKPFKTIQHAVNSAMPGVAICVANGTYSENIVFNKSGTADGWIMLRTVSSILGIPEAKPGVIISPPSNNNAITINGHSYIWIEGFEINGGLFGIAISGGHHAVVIHNLVHGTAASGIQLNNGDYRMITRNTVHDCAKTWTGNGSGISIYTPTAMDAAPGFHNVIDQNVSFNNSNPKNGTDGNGIIFDDGKHTQSDHKVFSPRSLIENNLVYFNGGAGIQVYNSINVTVRNNTAYWNRQLMQPKTVTWLGELSNEFSDEVIWVNNIAWANTAFNTNHTITALLQGGSANVVWLQNITYNGKKGDASINFDVNIPPNNLFGQNPLLVNPPSQLADLPSADFRLQPGSPAIGAGTPFFGPTLDLVGNPRTNPVDIGAYAAGAMNRYTP